MFTTESAIEHNKKMLEMGKHPSQNPEIIKRTNDRMLKDGTHPFLNKKNRENNRKKVKEKQLEMSSSGTHNFKGRVAVVDVQGNRVMIPTEDYQLQKDGKDMSKWNYVMVNSKEGRKRVTL